MFTKSGRKLVRISIPLKQDLPTPNGDTIQNNNVNGHINSILDELVSRGCTVTPIMPDLTPKEERSCITPASKRKKPVKTGGRPDRISEILAAENCCISSNDALKSKRRPKLNKVQNTRERSISSVRSETAYNQTQIDQQTKQVFTALKAKDILIAAPTGIQHQDHQLRDKSSSAGSSSTDKQPFAGTNEKPSNINIRRIINGIEYVPFTSPSNVVKRDRLIQVNEFEMKETQEFALQCDLIEDESSSESSQSDWINEIIEEYEFLEENDMYECQICGEVCPSHLSNLKHSMTHKESSLLCFRCGRLFPNTTKLLEHEDKMHPEGNLKIKKALRCPKLNCLKAFHSKRQLFDHIDQHGTRLNEQRCSKCQRSFASPLQLLCHINRRNCWR